MTELLPDLLFSSAQTHAGRAAVVDRDQVVSYERLAALVEAVAGGLLSLGVHRGDRIAVLLPKRLEKVASLIGAMRAGAVAVPMNALLRAPQVTHILRDCGVTVLVTSAARLPDLSAEPNSLAGLRAIVVVDEVPAAPAFLPDIISWAQFVAAGPSTPHRVIDADAAALFYTSGSTGKPKGVILSHRNLVAGARSVAGYLGNTAEDRILALLSLSFDYGFSQLTTSFVAGASVVLLDYRLPQEVMQVIERERVTGLAGVPPVWIQLAEQAWPASAHTTLRYLTNSGGALPGSTLARLRAALPRTRVYLMYGLTEAFRSTYLPPEEIDRRPGSIGKAIPNAEVLVLRPDGTPCDANEPGELVHRGALVGLGYWGDPTRTAERFRPIPPQSPGITQPEIAVWSGDIVRRDEEGFLHFIGRRDEMIKTSGYRVSPTEVEEEAHATGLVTDAVALGVPHERLGQAIVLVVSPARGRAADSEGLLEQLGRRLPRYMVPARVDWREALPRTPNGKFDRALLRQELSGAFAAERA
jgi:acyl-CoA ligase (AMP-forming) (exosortase A-associated)